MTGDLSILMLPVVNGRKHYQFSLSSREGVT